MATTGTDAGWYPDPERGRLRYFDGEKWGPYAPEDIDPTDAAQPDSPTNVRASAAPNELQTTSPAADSRQTPERPEPTELPNTGLLFGGKPSAFLRVAYLLVAVGALVYGVWSFMANHADLGPVAWFTAVSYAVAVLLGLVAVAQAAAPVRFLWPGWLFVGLAVLPIVWTSLMTWMAQITTYGSNRLFWLDFFFPFIMTMGMALALVAWHVQLFEDGRAPDYLLDNGVTSPSSGRARAKTRIH